LRESVVRGYANQAPATSYPILTGTSSSDIGIGLALTDNDRISESTVDIGAYEFQSDVTFADGFESF